MIFNTDLGKVFREKNLLRFGHGKNCLDTPPPCFLDTYKALCRQSGFFCFFKCPLDNVQIEADDFSGYLLLV